jgi:two-component system, cell cycle sensor histidine kinase and response regulator CckA
VSRELGVPQPSRATEIARLELSRLAPDLPLDHVFRRTCEITANALCVERVGVWLFIDDHTVLRCANLYERSKNEHSAGTVLRVADFPTYFSSLRIRRAVPAEVAVTETWTAELADAYLRPLGVGSMLDAGIFVEAELVGVVCHEHVGSPCEWTTEARDFAGSVADLLALRLQSAEVRELRNTFQQQRSRLAAQDKASALEQLAAGVAHDFKNLLTVFLGHGGLLSERRDLPADARGQAEEIVSAAERGVALTTELLEFARQDPRPPSVVDPVALIEDCMRVLQSAVGSRHELRFARPGAVGQVLIEKTQFNRMLLNLVLNARDAMPDGGPIDVRLAPVELEGNASYTGRFVLLEVADHGTGIDDATRRRIFEPYFTTKHKGTGLGLAIVRQVVDRAGGLIRVESQPNAGTQFRIFLPRIGANTGQTKVFSIPPELRAGGKDGSPTPPGTNC